MSVAHDGDAIAGHEGLLLVMGDVDERHSETALQLAQFDLELLAQFEVEGGERFVEEEHLRFVDDGAGEGDALFLSAG